MKKIFHKFTALIMTIMMGAAMVAPALQTAPVYADGEADAKGAAILTGCYDEGQNNHDGSGIKCVITLVINILSVLVGVVGIIGIVVVGIQYLTAGGNEEQTRKAKRRLFEIIIGIVAFILTGTLLKWLLPEFH